MGFASTSATRIAAILSLIALVAITISDFVLTEFWDTNAMITSIVADVLVLVVGVAVVNEFINARARRQWRIVADYALVELASTCRHVWVILAERIGAGNREQATRDEMRELIGSRERLGELALTAVAEPAARRDLQEVLSKLVSSSRDALTSWAPLLVETSHAGSLSCFVELQAQLSRIDLALWEEVTGKRPTFKGTGNPEWLAERIVTAIQLGSKLEVEFFDAAAMIEAEERTEARVF